MATENAKAALTAIGTSLEIARLRDATRDLSVTHAANARPCKCTPAVRGCRWYGKPLACATTLPSAHIGTIATTRIRAGISRISTSAENVAAPTRPRVAGVAMRGSDMRSAAERGQMNRYIAGTSAT